MINITDILSQDYIILDCHISSKKRVLEMLSKLLAEQTSSVVYQDILTSLIERENLGSTAIGHGVALPHARFDEIDHPIAAIVRLYSGEGLIYDDNEDGKIDVVFGLIVPHDNPDAHLQLLASVAQHFHEGKFREAFRQATNAEQICKLFSSAVTS